jgi:hypothetical protein
MWMYLGQRYPNHPSSEELSAVEVESQIRKVLDLGVNLTPGVGPVPLLRGITSVRVSTSGPVLASRFYVFHYVRNLVQGRGSGCGEPQDADLTADTIEWEVRHASSEEMLSREES